MRYYPFIIDDHYLEHVKNAQGTDHWEDRGGRILKPAPEKLFHRSLAQWLKLFVSGPPRVTRTAVDPAGDQTDIEVNVDGDTYIIEIKWLGRTTASYYYDKTQLNVGAEQLKTYLDNDSSVMLGILVAYDGRSLAEHREESGIDDGHKHVRGDYFIKYLESQTASEAAKSAVRKKE